MYLVFLSSRLALTKTFAVTNGELAATPYPHVSKVTSHHVAIDGLDAFHAALVEHAKAGHCLFGGQLKRPLHGESRAGLTAADAKAWVVFDFDKVEAKDAADVVKRYLPAECQQVSYIAQLSASMFELVTWRSSPVAPCGPRCRTRYALTTRSCTSGSAILPTPRAPTASCSRRLAR